MLKKGGIRITLYSPRFLFLSSLKINLKTVRRMIEINHSCRAFLNNKGQVVIRVRWNNRDGEVGFSVGCKPIQTNGIKTTKELGIILLIKLVERQW